MALSSNGTTTVVGYEFGSVPASLSYSLCYRNAAAPSTPTERVFTIGSSNLDHLLFAWHHPSSAFQQSVIHRSVGGGYKAVKLTTSLAANTFYNIGGRYDASTDDITAWLNGTLETTIVSDGDHGTSGTLQIKMFQDLLAGSQDDGILAFVGVWSVALSNGEMAALGKGYHPRLIRPASLILSVDFNRSVQPHQGGWTVSQTDATTFVDNPRIILPKRRRLGG